MRNLMVALCSVLMCATLLAQARSEPLSYAVGETETRAVAGVQEALCGNSSGHVTCQLVLAGQVASPMLKFAPTSFLLGFAPVRATSRIFSPQPPPPRHFS